MFTPNIFEHAKFSRFCYLVENEAEWANHNPSRNFNLLLAILNQNSDQFMVGISKISTKKTRRSHVALSVTAVRPRFQSKMAHE